MRKYLLASGITGLALLGSACTPSRQPESALPSVSTTWKLEAPSEPSTAVSGEPAATALTAPEPKVAAALFTDLADELDMDTDEAINAASSICDTLGSGGTLEELMIRMASNPNLEDQMYDVGQFVGASIFAFCPEYTGQMETFMSKYG